jgi:hypothetical protein
MPELTILFGRAFVTGPQLVVLDPLAAEDAAVLLLVWLLRNEFDGVHEGTQHCRARIVSIHSG